MLSITAITLSVCSIIAVSFAAPTTYDQRQDGDLNFSTKVENVWIVVGIPSETPSLPSISPSELATYAALLNDGRESSENSSEHDVLLGDDDKKEDQVIPAPNNNDEVSGESSGDDDVESPVKTALQSEKNTSEKATETEEKTSGKGAAKRGRSLWSQIEEVVDNNRKGLSLKKELSWGQDVDPIAPVRDGDDSGDQNRSNDHNEVGLVANNHFTLLGSGIEDCGPDRQRNSYGICQPALSTE